MRWKAPSDKVQMVLLSPILVPLFICFVPMFFALAAWERWGPQAKWRSWFAWRPVNAFHAENDGLTRQWVWLERIEKFSGVCASTDYRISSRATHLRPTPSEGEEE